MDDNEIQIKESGSVTEPIVSRELLVKQGTSAVIYFAGGLLLFIMTFVARHPILGILLPVAALAVGAGSLLSRSREDKKPGLIFALAGVAGLIVRFGIPLIRPFAAFALVLGAIGLVTAGIWKGIRFLAGLKTRQ